MLEEEILTRLKAEDEEEDFDAEEDDWEEEGTDSEEDWQDDDSEV